MQKRFERFQYALSLLDTEIKFDTDESIELNRSEAEWPKDIAEVNELWRKRVKYDALNQFELISDDAINGTTTHKDAILAIKSEFPKPS